MEAELDAVFSGYLDAYRAHWRAFPDAAPALRRLQEAGVKVGVLTNGHRDQQEAKLTATGLDSLCGQLFASSELGVAKPDPRAYLEACRRLGSRHHQTLMVGDDYDLDVIAARKAGLYAVHLDRLAVRPAPDPLRISTLLDIPLGTHAHRDR